MFLFGVCFFFVYSNRLFLFFSSSSSLLLLSIDSLHNIRLIHRSLFLDIIQHLMRAEKKKTKWICPLRFVYAPFFDRVIKIFEKN
jgi:hypothetical protein